MTNPPPFVDGVAARPALLLAIGHPTISEDFTMSPLSSRMARLGAGTALAAICFWFAVSPLRSADADPLKEEFDKIETMYKYESDQLKKAVLASLNKREDQARTKADKEWIDLVKNDRKIYENTARIPTATPRSIMQYADKVRTNYANALNGIAGKYAKAGNDELAAFAERKAKSYLANTPEINLKEFSLVPTSELDSQVEWRYTTTIPIPDWVKPTFNDGGWNEGKAPFGNFKDYPNSRTSWTSQIIWMRKTFELSSDKLSKVYIRANHDDHGKVYINGVEACNLRGWTDRRYRPYLISLAAAKTLKPGLNTVAVTCTNIGFGQFLDVGIIDIPGK